MTPSVFAGTAAGCWANAANATIKEKSAPIERIINNRYATPFRAAVGIR
jgi:hypothetical protein